MSLSVPEIEKILAKHDPIGLIRMGAPQDEYKHEAKKIYNSLRCLNKQPKVQYVQDLVAYIFNQAFKLDDDSFGVWMRRSDYVVSIISLDLCELMDAS